MPDEPSPNGHEPAPEIPQILSQTNAQFVATWLPARFAIDIHPDYKLLQLTFSTPAGVNTVFMNAEAAVGLANQLIQAAKAARSGLIVTDKLPPEAPR